MIKSVTLFHLSLTKIRFKFQQTVDSSEIPFLMFEQIQFLQVIPCKPQSSALLKKSIYAKCNVVSGTGSWNRKRTLNGKLIKFEYVWGLISSKNNQNKILYMVSYKVSHPVSCFSHPTLASVIYLY